MANAMARGSWTPFGGETPSSAAEGQHAEGPVQAGQSSSSVNSSSPHAPAYQGEGYSGQSFAAPAAPSSSYAPNPYPPQGAQAPRGDFSAPAGYAAGVAPTMPSGIGQLPFAYAHLGSQPPAGAGLAGSGGAVASSPHVPFTPPSLNTARSSTAQAAGAVSSYQTAAPAAITTPPLNAPSVRVQPVPGQTLPPPVAPAVSDRAAAAPVGPLSARSAGQASAHAAGYPSSARPAANTPFPVAAPHATGKFAALGHPRRIWVVSSIHGEVDKLRVLHDEIGRLFQPGDRLIYLGNFLGVGPDVLSTVDELLDFRRALIAMPGMLASDVVYLRGGQEEMWSKLLQIQFAPNPVEVMNWMLRQGAEVTLHAYRGNPQQGLSAARDGVMAMTRWTSLLRAEIRTRPGHETLYSSLKRAAFTGDGAQTTHGGLLFVNAGLDYNKPLASQGDSFWWGAASWGSIVRPYGVFSKVIRGYDPAHGGSSMTTHTLTIDGGCGFGGSLMGACLTASGEVIDVIEV